MHALKVFAKVVGILLAVLVVFVLVLFAIASTADFSAVELTRSIDEIEVVDRDGYRECLGGKFRRNEHGLWEMYVEGSPEERGFAMSALTSNLVRNQEDVFIAQIRRVVSSDSYARFLKLFLDLFNRNLNENIPLECRTEISAIAQSCSDEYDFLGDAYERQLHYHAAHDIGHVMQGYMLVGCSSFATRNAYSADSTLIVGRNFDFYFGDDFARNRIVSFVRPENGFPFASIIWPGMVGAVSGMNAEGLTVTINAAQGPLAKSASTPITIVVRQILQYASTVDEAIKIADENKTFVSESILVTSAKDRRMVIIEKTPEKTAIYESDGDRISCTNHYQSEAFANDDYNVENIKNTDSYDRQFRLNQLVDSLSPMTPENAVKVLRDHKGIDGRDIGIGNEKSINQFLGHHSVVFRPDSLQMWVSTSPWQAGEFVCYDLRYIFSDEVDFSKEICTEQKNIEADSLMVNVDAMRKIRFDAVSQKITSLLNDNRPAPKILQCEMLRINPNLYRTHMILADCLLAEGDNAGALSELETALRCVLPTESVRKDIVEKIEEISAEVR